MPGADSESVFTVPKMVTRSRTKKSNTETASRNNSRSRTSSNESDSRLLSSPRKTKHRKDVECPVTPPKLKKEGINENFMSPTSTASSLLDNMTINSPSKNGETHCFKKTFESSSETPLNETDPKSKGLLSSPRKTKHRNDVECPVTPPKLRKDGTDENFMSPTSTASSLLDNLMIDSPNKNGEKHCSKKLFEGGSSYQTARKALHSTFPTEMPGREEELQTLREFLKQHLEDKSSGTMYISGPPGTGKTASLSKILQEEDILSEFKEVYINCTAIKSSTSIYARIVRELGLKTSGKTEKDNLSAIESYLPKNHKMILLVLDELDQLESKKQSVLYTIFEWPAKPKSKLILIGIANALDLTDRILPRLQARCELKPQLMHFAPYTKIQITEIFTDRLKQAGVLEVFSPVAIQMLAAKVAAISGDVRRALDIGRRVIELVEQNKKTEVLRSIDNLENETPKLQTVDLKQVVNVLNNVYGTTHALVKNDDNEEESFPLQQKIVICSLLLYLKKAKNKDVTIGKLHEVYRKVCSKRNLLGVDQAEFVGLCSLIETKGIIRVSGKKEPRLHKVHLEWDESEVSSCLKDKQLMSSILHDVDCLGKF